MIKYVISLIFILSTFLNHSTANDSPDPQSSIREQQSHFGQTESTPLNFDLTQSDNGLRNLHNDDLNKFGFCCGRLACYYATDSDYHNSYSETCCRGICCDWEKSPYPLGPIVSLIIGVVDVAMLPPYLIGATFNACAGCMEREKFQKSYKRGLNCYPEDCCSFTSVKNGITTAWNCLWDPCCK